MYVAFLLRFRIASCDLETGLRFRNWLRFGITRFCYRVCADLRSPLVPGRPPEIVKTCKNPQDTYSKNPGGCFF